MRSAVEVGNIPKSVAVGIEAIAVAEQRKSNRHCSHNLFEQTGMLGATIRRWLDRHVGSGSRTVPVGTSDA